MTAAVTRNLALLSAAPGGIKALRQLIFDLAIAGSLLPQQGSDQPAEAVLIATAAMRPSTAARRSGNVRNCARAEGLPSGWVATTVGEVLICRDSERIPVSQADRETRAKVYDYYGASGVIDKIDGFLFDKPLLLVGEDGANLINRSTPIAFIARGRYWVNNHAHVLDGIDEDLLRYMALFFNAIDLKPYVTGTAQPKLNQAKLNAIPVSLPPQAEQRRIVAKVNELMALCDRLEARQQDAEAAHARLVQALLDSLTQARDADEFQAYWRRMSGQFPEVFQTSASIDALQLSLYELAISGRLVEQRSDEEPASVPLHNIREAKRRAGQLDAPAHTRVVAGRDTPKAALPLGWAQARFADIALEVATGPFGSLIHQSDYQHGGVPLINPSHMVGGRIVADPRVALPPEKAQELSAYRLNEGDMVMARRGEVGRVALVSAAEHGWLCGTGSFRLRFTDDVHTSFIRLLFQAPSVRRYLAGAAVGTTMVNLNHGVLAKMPVGLPPLAEQRRIVAKVTELLALCDQLKARITAARAKHAQLAEAVVAQAVAA